jgi:hypothetical protein
MACLIRLITLFFVHAQHKSFSKLGPFVGPVEKHLGISLELWHYSDLLTPQKI